MSQEDFGPRLKQFRRHRRLTQNDISKLLNISRQAYSNYEQGRCLPPPDTLADLSIILNTNLFISFIQSSSYKNHAGLSQIQDVPEEEAKALLDLYSRLPIDKRVQLLSYILQDFQKERHLY